jgi:hypothetical protein
MTTRLFRQNDGALGCARMTTQLFRQDDDAIVSPE